MNPAWPKELLLLKSLDGDDCTEPRSFWKLGGVSGCQWLCPCSWGWGRYGRAAGFQLWGVVCGCSRILEVFWMSGLCFLTGSAGKKVRKGRNWKWSMWRCSLVGMVIDLRVVFQKCRLIGLFLKLILLVSRKLPFLCSSSSK